MYDISDMCICKDSSAIEPFCLSNCDVCDALLQMTNICNVIMYVNFVNSTQIVYTV